LGVDDPNLVEFYLVWALWNLDLDLADFVYNLLEAVFNKLVLGVEVLPDQSLLLEEGLLQE